MPVSVVVGGQFGSEGKGKVALELARSSGATAAIRVGGPNSGHTALDESGTRHVFRHLPTAALLPRTDCVIAAGAYIDPHVLLDEISLADLAASRVIVDPWAVVIEHRHRQIEQASGLRERIGSTLSGTGAAVAARVQRHTELRFAKDEPLLKAFVEPVTPWLRAQLRRGARIIIEGTQGFGLSLLHSAQYPHVTSRDTTAAAFVAEAGLSPLDVDEVVLVIRAFPIRVAGASGPLPHETSWDILTRESGSPLSLMERTSVTQRVRRIGRFEPGIVLSAMEINNPTKICLNHADYFDANCSNADLTDKAFKEVCKIEKLIGQEIDFVGTGPATMIGFSTTVKGEGFNGRTRVLA